MNYFLLINNEQKGPYTVEFIKRSLVDCRIGPGTMAWREGLEEWKAVSQMPELAALLSVTKNGRRSASIKWLRIPAAIFLFAGVSFLLIVGGSSGGIVPGILGGDDIGVGGLRLSGWRIEGLFSGTRSNSNSSRWGARLGGRWLRGNWGGRCFRNWAGHCDVGRSVAPAEGPCVQIAVGCRRGSCSDLQKQSTIRVNK